MEAPSNSYAVILAGGGGTRLWPKSRQKIPKHLVKLVGEQTIIRQTFDRILPLIPLERIFVITREEQVELVKKELPELSADNIIKEPEAKNTAMAMGVAAAFVHKRNPQAVITYLAADQTIENETIFRHTLAKALEVALLTEQIVAIGIRPTFAHTGLGYIRIGSQVDTIGQGKKELFVFHSRGFKEKPDLATAQSFLASEEYLWNANLYSWTTETIFKALAKYTPEISQAVSKVLAAIDTPAERQVMKDVYAQAENIQIDIAVSEKVDNMLVIPGDFGWSDVGDWKVVYDTLKKDESRNVVEAHNYINIKTVKSLIEGNGRLIVTVGLEDIMVIDTPDALLVCHKDYTQDVKKVVEKLKELGKEEYL